MPEVFVEPIAMVGVLLAVLFTAASGVTNWRGIQLIVIGAVFSWLPFVREVASTWIAG